jgi:hypothetical protein
VNEGTPTAREHLLDAPTVEQRNPLAFLRPAHVVDATLHGTTAACAVHRSTAAGAHA